MMPRSRFLTLLAAALLAGCSIMGAQPEPEAGTAETQAPKKEEPVGEFTPEALYLLTAGEIAGQRGEIGEALGFYLEAARETQDAGVAERAARIAMLTRSLPATLEAAQIWTKAAPEDPEAHQVLAIALLRNGEPEQAIEQFEQMLALGQGGPEQHFLIIAALLSREHPVEAAYGVMQTLAERHADSAEAQLALAELALRHEKMEDALAAADRALSLRPDWAEAATLRARILVRSQRTDEALAYLKGALRKYPDSEELRMTYARLLVQLDRMDEARAAFRELVRRTPDNGDAIFALGLLSMQAELNDEAEKLFKRLIDLDNSANTRAQYYLGQLAELREEYQEAIDWYSAVRNGPNYEDAQLRIAIALAHLGEVDAAREHLQGLANHDPAFQARIYQVEGEILVNAERLEEAMKLYNQALDEQPGNHDLRYARALLGERMDNLELLESDLRTILEDDPDNAEALNALGYTLADRTDRFDEALALVKRALELSPEDAAVIDSMGWVLYRLGKRAEAETYLRKALSKRENDPEIAAHLGEVLWTGGQHAEAETVWNRALKHHPDDAVLKETIQRLKGQ